MYSSLLINYDKWYVLRQSYISNKYREVLFLNSLRFKMPVIVLLGVVPPMLGAIFFSIHLAEEKLQQEADKNLAVKAKILANTVSWWNQMNVLTLKQISQQSDIVSMDGERQKPVLKNLVQTNKNLYLASTTDLNGLNVARSDESKPMQYEDRPWFLGARAGKDITYQILISRTIKKPAVCMGSPIRQKPSEIAGVMMLCTELSALAEQIGELQFGKSGYALVVDRTGKVLAHPNSSFLSGTELKDFSQHPPVTNILEGRGGPFSFKDEQGIDWTSYGISLENGWKVTIIQKKVEVLEDEQEFRTVAYLVALVALIAVIGLTWLSANHLIRPISQLTTAAKAIANGQLDRRVEIERQDELGSLATSFNQMAKRLKTSFKELEHRVRNRTAELSKAKEAAEDANQTKDRFLARISHELRSPLNSIISYATILQEQAELTPYQAKGLRVVKESGVHLLTLIEDLLDFSKVKVSKIELHPTYLNLQSFLDGIVGMVEMWAQEKQVMFECETMGNLDTAIWVDEKRLRQVLINLLSNAIKFTEQGKVTLRVTVLNQTEEVSSTTPFPQQKLRFLVIDTGIGISPEHLEKIFQPFEQVGLSEQAAQGTGLGLAISKQLVEIMGSQLKVKSQIGIGSTFWFDLSLPKAHILPEAQENGTVKALSPSGRRGKILIVDDKEENHFTLLSILNPLGFEIVCAINGKQALEIAPSVRPDLILLDLFMPVKTGFTLVRELRKIPEFDTIPIILISASSYEVVKKASHNLGCEGFLTKPIDEGKLLDLLKEYGMLTKNTTF